MPQVYQTYVSQISNNYDGEILALSMLEEFSPIAAQMSKVALLGLQNQIKKDKLNTQLQKQFNVNKRHANSIINFVSGALASAQECHKAHIETLSAKIKVTKKSVEDLKKRLKAHREYVQAVEKRNLAIKTPEKTKSVKPKKVPLFTKKPEFDDACPINGKQYYGMTYLQMAKQKLHQKKRQLQMYVDRQARVIKGGVHVNLGNLGSIPFIGSTGESNSNQICQLTPDVIPSLKIRVPYFLEESFGEYVVLPLYKINQSGYDLIRSAWALNAALTYVFYQNKKGKWVVSITCNVDFFIRIKDHSTGCIGLDINPGTIGWCSTDQFGNPSAWGKVNLDLHSCSTEQTEARLADVVTEITQRALATKKPIVIEKLDFSEKKKQFKKGRKYNRMLSGFAYRRFSELLKARCLKLGIKVIEVSPRYSSQIGVLKYMRRYGMGSDSAAGLVLARRGMGIYHERLPASCPFQTSIQAEARQHAKLAGESTLPGRLRVFAHWQRFGKYYLEQGSRNAWFAPNLTGSSGSSSMNTGSTANEVVKRTLKASVGGRECKPRLVVEA